MKHQFAFPKEEHLCGEIRINKLFTEGKAFIVYPIRIVYRIDEKNDDVPLKVLVSVPKKRFKRAVKRNRIKRLMREAYRLNKIPLINIVEAKHLNLHIALNYVSNEEVDYKLIELKVIDALKKIADKIETQY